MTISPFPCVHVSILVLDVIHISIPFSFAILDYQRCILMIWEFRHSGTLFILLTSTRIDRAPDAGICVSRIRGTDSLVLGLVEHGRSSKTESICFTWFWFDI